MVYHQYDIEQLIRFVSTVKAVGDLPAMCHLVTQIKMQLVMAKRCFLAVQVNSVRCWFAPWLGDLDSWLLGTQNLGVDSVKSTLLPLRIGQY